MLPKKKMVIMISKIDAIDKKVYNMNFCPSLFIEISVSSQESERLCICVRWMGSNLSIFLRVLY